MTRDKDSPFGTRLRLFVAKALRRENPVNTSEVARFFGVVPSAGKNYVSGTRYPDLKKLIEIARSENLSLDWLFLNRGEKDADPLRFLDERTRSTVATVAAKLKTTPEALLGDLAVEALARRAVEMIENRRHLDGSQVDQLHAILQLIEANDEVTATAGSVSSPRGTARTK